MTVIASIREYFLLSDARATAKTVPEDARLAIGRQLAVGRQRAEAADALWSNGHVAEGLRLAAEAFEETLEAVVPFERATGTAQSPRAASAHEDLRDDERAPDREASEPEEANRDEAAAAPPSGAAEGEASEPSTAASEASEVDEAARTEARELDEAARTEASEVDEAARTEANEIDEVSDAPGGEDEGTARADASDEDAARASDEGSLETLSAPTRAPAPSLGDEPAWAAAFRRRGLSDSKLRVVLETERTRRAKPLPLLDDEVSAAEGDLFQQLVTARRHVEGLLSPVSMTPGQLAWTRTSRIGFAAILGAAVLAGVYLLVRPPTGVEATGSAQYNAEFVPERAIDGDEATEWLLPDRQQGWIDVRIMPPERIETLRLKNAHNRHYNDRATHEYTVQVYSNGRLARTIEGSWQGIAPRPPWTEHELGVDDVERIRVNVRSWHRNGAGLAEIDWE